MVFWYTNSILASIVSISGCVMVISAIEEKSILLGLGGGVLIILGKYLSVRKEEKKAAKRQQELQQAQNRQFGDSQYDNRQFNSSQSGSGQYENRVRYCTSCGAQIPAGSLFCTNCGTKVG